MELVWFVCWLVGWLVINSDIRVVYTLVFFHTVITFSTHKTQYLTSIQLTHLATEFHLHNSKPSSRELSNIFRAHHVAFYSLQIKSFKKFSIFSRTYYCIAF